MGTKPDPDARSPAAEAFLEAAEAHGEDDPDMETGDLRILFRVAYGLLSDARRRAFLADPEIVELLECLEYADLHPRSGSEPV